MKIVLFLMAGLTVLAGAVLVFLAQERPAPVVELPADALVVLDNPQFAEPEGWQWQRLETSTGHVRWGYTVTPEARGVVLFMPGYSAPLEIYFETFSRLKVAGYSVAALDWPGQGGSARGSSSAEKIHATSLAGHVSAARAVTTQVQDLFPGAPLFAVGLSMGAQLGTRLVAEEPGVFSAAALVTPAYLLYGARPTGIERTLLQTMVAIGFGERYLPGNTDWVFDLDAHNGVESNCSHPNERTKLWYASTARDKAIRVGGMSNAFLLAMVESGRVASAADVIGRIGIPVWMPLAENDWYVDNPRAREVCAALGQCDSVEYPEARHCLFEEADDYYLPFITDLIEFLDKHS